MYNMTGIAKLYNKFLSFMELDPTRPDPTRGSTRHACNSGPVIWNSLPAALRTATLSPLTFARHLKAHLFGWSTARLRTINLWRALQIYSSSSSLSSLSSFIFRFRVISRSTTVLMPILYYSHSFSVKLKTRSRCISNVDTVTWCKSDKKNMIKTR